MSPAERFLDDDTKATDRAGIAAAREALARTPRPDPQPDDRRPR